MPIGRVPDPAELAEDFKELKVTMDQSFRELRADIRALDQTYLRERLYLAESRARDAEIQVLRTAIDTNNRMTNARIDSTESEKTANRRLALAALVFPTILIFISFILPRILTP